MNMNEKMKIFELYNGGNGFDFTKAADGGLYKDSETLKLFFMFSTGYFIGKVHGLQQ